MKKFDCIGPLVKAGIDYEDAKALRRISMTLNRWFCLECGDGNNYASWALERDENEVPYMVTYPHQGKSYRRRVPDREAGARKRLHAILKKYPSLKSYVQSDPRGASLYILRPGDVPEGKEAMAYYTNGLVVC